jgi:hypothetical protein
MWIPGRRYLINSPPASEALANTRSRRVAQIRQSGVAFEINRCPQPHGEPGPFCPVYWIDEIASKATTSTAVISSGLGDSSEPGASATPVPPEVESTLSRISSHRNVRGVMVLSRDGPVIRYSGAIFDGDHGRRYAGAVKKIVDTCKTGLDEVAEGGVCISPPVCIETRTYADVLTPRMMSDSYEYGRESTRS